MHAGYFMGNSIGKQTHRRGMSLDDNIKMSIRKVGSEVVEPV
jgi:hypothetical protein